MDLKDAMIIVEVRAIWAVSARIMVVRFSEPLSRFDYDFDIDAVDCPINLFPRHDHCTLLAAFALARVKACRRTSLSLRVSAEKRVGMVGISR